MVFWLRGDRLSITSRAFPQSLVRLNLRAFGVELLEATRSMQENGKYSGNQSESRRIFICASPGKL